MAAAAVSAASGAVEAAGQTAREAIKTTQEFYEENVQKPAYAAFARKGAFFDYEKVFWNSAYSIGMFGLFYGAIKLGQFMIGTVDLLANIDFLDIVISEKMRTNMDKFGHVLAVLDEQIGGVAPIMPVGLVGLHASLEYFRIRKGLPQNEQKAGDAAIGLGAIYTLFLASEGLKYNLDHTPTDGAGDGNQNIEDYRGFTLVKIFQVGTTLTPAWKIVKSSDPYALPADKMVVGDQLDGYFFTSSEEGAATKLHVDVNKYWFSVGFTGAF